MLTAAQQLGVQAYIDHVSKVYDFLAKERDLSPHNPKINAILHRFVEDTMEGRSPREISAILGAPEIQKIAPRLRKLLSSTEHEMEHFCAAAMIEGETESDPRFSSYGNFIYRRNYEALVAAELHAVKWHDQIRPADAGCQSIAFVGAGPLPISAIMLHQRTGLRVTCIDSDEKACQLGGQLLVVLAAKQSGCKDIDKAIRFVRACGEEHDYGTHPVVFIASLVESKDGIIDRIVGTSNAATTTVIRSAQGLSTLLYSPEGGVDGQERYKAHLVGKTTPSSEVINTSLVYRFPPTNRIEGAVIVATERCGSSHDCFE